MSGFLIASVPCAVNHLGTTTDEANMKLALFNDYIPGVVNGDRIVDLSGILGQAIMGLPPADRMLALIADFDRLRGKIADASTGQGVPLSGIRLRAPVPRPSKMLFGLGNYRENVNGALAPLGLFLKSPSSILDPGGTVKLPAVDAVIIPSRGGTRLCHRETRQGHSRGRGSQPRLRLYVRSGCVGARIGRWSTLHRQVARYVLSDGAVDRHPRGNSRPAEAQRKVLGERRVAPGLQYRGHGASDSRDRRMGVAGCDSRSRRRVCLRHQSSGTRSDAGW